MFNQSAYKDLNYFKWIDDYQVYTCNKYIKAECVDTRLYPCKLLIKSKHVFNTHVLPNDYPIIPVFKSEKQPIIGCKEFI